MLQTNPIHRFFLHTMPAARLQQHCHSGSRCPISGFDPAEYSRFKYGCGTAAAAYGQALAQSFFTRHGGLPGGANGQDVLVASSAYRYVPTASGAVARSFLHALNLLLHGQGQAPVRQFPILRASVFAGDYGTLDHAQRLELMRQNRLYADRDLLYGRHLLVLDDVRMTGAHEARVLEALLPAQPASIHLLYLLGAEQLDAGTGPTLEHELNHADIHTLPQLVALMQQPGYCLNARACKLVLGTTDTASLAAAAWQMPPLVLHQLLHGAIADGYATMPMYAGACTTLQDVAAQRGCLHYPAPVPEMV